MRIHAIASLMLGLAATGTAIADQRPPLSAVSAVRIGNYGAPSVTVSGQQARRIVDELNALRKKDWRPGEARLSCYATVVMLKGTKTAGLLRVGREFIVERTLGKGQSSYSLQIENADAAQLKKLLSEIAPPKCD